MTVLVLAACGDEDGEALQGGPETPPPTSQASTSPNASGQGGGLEKLKACDLLHDTEAATISKGFAAVDMGAGSGASSGCMWSTSIDRGVPNDKRVNLSINIRPWQTVDQTEPGLGKATDGEVGEGRKAKQVVEDAGEGTCLLAFAADNGRVDIAVQAKPSDRACEIAGKVSTLVESKLPEPTG